MHEEAGLHGFCNQLNIPVNIYCHFYINNELELIRDPSNKVLLMYSLKAH